MTDMPTTASLYIGATQIITQASTPNPTVQDFTSSGTWAEPGQVYQGVFVECIGGGAGPAAGPVVAGNGGNYACAFISAAKITGNVTVTVGAGGAVQYSGGASSFGGFVTATGGDAGGGAQPPEAGNASFPGGEAVSGANGQTSALGAGAGAPAGKTGGTGGTNAAALGALQAGNGGVGSGAGTAPGGGGGYSTGTGARGQVRVTTIY